MLPDCRDLHIYLCSQRLTPLLSTPTRALLVCVSFLFHFKNRKFFELCAWLYCEKPKLRHLIERLQLREATDDKQPASGLTFLSRVQGLEGGSAKTWAFKRWKMRSLSINHVTCSWVTLSLKHRAARRPNLSAITPKAAVSHQGESGSYVLVRCCH